MVIQYNFFSLYYLIGWVTNGSKCKWCIEEIKMKKHKMINLSLCLLNDHSKNVVSTWFLSIRWAKIIIDTKKKMAREEKHWKVGNSNVTLSHKDGKLWLFYVQHTKVKSKWKICWLLWFVGLTTRKLNV